MRTYPPEVEARRAARRERERRRRMRARRRRAATLGVLLLVLAASGTAWALWPKGAEAEVSPRGLGAAPVLPVRVRAHAVEVATGRMRALAVELNKPKGPPSPPTLVPAPRVKTIVVDKSDQTVTLYKADGKPLDRFPCATGQTYPRVGTYKVTSRKAASMYPADGSRFTHFVIFTQSDKKTNIGFHSIPIDREGNPIGGLGSPESHGCVRLANDKAEFVYDWAANGTKVIVQK